MKTCLFAVLIPTLCASAGAYGAEIIVPVRDYAVVDHAGHTKLLLSFDTIDSLAAVSIVRAECLLSFEFDTLCEERMDLIVSPILSQWSAATIQASLSTDTSSLQSSASGSWLFSISKGGTERVTIPVTEIVRSWCSGQRANRGIVIRPVDEFTECRFAPGTLVSDSVNCLGYLVIRTTPRPAEVR